jgi:hypothetical protein
MADSVAAVAAAVAHYQRHGFCTLPGLFSAAEVAELQERMEHKVDSLARRLFPDPAAERQRGQGLPFDRRLVHLLRGQGDTADRHLALGPGVFSVASDVPNPSDRKDLRVHHGLVTHPRLLRCVQAVLGTPEVSYAYAGICRAKLPLLVPAAAGVAGASSPARERACVATPLHQDSYVDAQKPEIHRVDPEFGSTLKALIGIYSQNAGSTCEFWVNPVNFTLKAQPQSC